MNTEGKNMDVMTSGGRIPGVKKASISSTPCGRLGPQLWVSRSGLPPSSDLLLPVRNDLFPKASKPALGGLWTSSYDARTRGSAWLDFWGRHADEDSNLQVEYPRPRFVLYPEADANILTIHSLADARLLQTHYRREWREGEPFAPTHLGLDFERIASEFDALHLSLRASLEMEEVNALSSWCIECTLWFRWVFKDQIVRCQP